MVQFTHSPLRGQSTPSNRPRARPSKAASPEGLLDPFAGLGINTDIQTPGGVSRDLITKVSLPTKAIDRQF